MLLAADQSEMEADVAMLENKMGISETNTTTTTTIAETTTIAAEIATTTTTTTE